MHFVGSLAICVVALTSNRCQRGFIFLFLSSKLLKGENNELGTSISKCKVFSFPLFIGGRKYCGLFFPLVYSKISVLQNSHGTNKLTLVATGKAQGKNAIDVNI